MSNKFEPLVSIIVPVYNAEKYLKECVDSLLGQSYKNLEILLIDDHSTDESWKICQRYAKRHKNITSYQTEKNSGSPLEGRRIGVKKAKGEWITFIDNDDYVKKDYIKHLVEGTEQGKYDISVTGHSLLHEDGSVEDFNWKNYSQTTTERLNEFYRHFIRGYYHTDPTDTVGQNLVRAEVAKKTNLDDLPSNIYAEDTVMALSFLANSKNGVNFVDHHDFLWRQLQGSGSHGGFYKRADRDAFYDACEKIFSRNDVKRVLDENISKISVIVPIYNVEKHLKRCLDSILNQTYKNLEIILVDDKTPDNSGKIADEYAKKDSRVKVIHKQKNQGLNMARATGFDVSTGTYVMFVDSDDAIARDCIEFALRAIVKNKAEFSKFNVLSFSDDKNLPPKMSSVDEVGEEKVITGKKDLYRSRFYNKTVGISRVTVWGGLYPRDAVQKIDWSKANYRQHEDMYWTMQFLEHVNKGVFTSRVGYFYRIDENNGMVLSKSLTGNMYNETPIGYLEFAKDYLNELERYNKKYDLEMDDEIKKFIAWQWSDRLFRLSKAEMLTSENNFEYLPHAIEAVINNYQDAKNTIASQQKSIEALNKEKNDLSDDIDKLRKENYRLKKERAYLQDQLYALSSVKRASLRVLSKAKRKIRSMIK